MTSNFRAPLLAALALALLLPCLGCVRKGQQPPVATHGLLDLSAWDAGRDGPVKLDGQWEFYWGRLLGPEDFKAGGASPEMTGYLAFPGTWRGFALGGLPLDGTGQATFRLRVLPGPGLEKLALRLFNIPAAYRLWANEKLLATSGVVGNSAETETAHRSLVLAELATDGAPLELVLQISNHNFRRGGVLDSIVLAAPGRLGLAHMRAWAWAIFFAGSLLVMGVYHFVLYSWRNKDASTLYFGLYCLLLVGYVSTSDSSEWMINLFSSNINPLFLERFSLVCYVLFASILYRFLRILYPKVFIPFIQYLCDVRSVLFILITVFQPSLFVYNTLHYIILTSFVFTGSVIFMLVICLRRGYDGALFLLCGSIILCLVGVNDIYCHLGIIKSIYLIDVGMYAFVLSQALALAQRFSNAFTDVELLSLDLQREMDERNQLEREIVNVSEEERRRLSHDLHDGLCQQLTGARLRCSVVERGLAKGQDAFGDLAGLSTLLEESVRHAYDLSRGLWPVERDPKSAGPPLEELVRRVGESSGIAIDFSQDLGCAPCVHQHLVQLYRIAQEAMANAVKHAKPSRISLTLGCGPEKKLTLVVSDDGVGRAGAARSKGGLGLRIMAHRARVIGGEFSISDARMGGTVVVCTVSCEAAPGGEG
jgi:signal transduction histidine kinase